MIASVAGLVEIGASAAVAVVAFETVASDVPAADDLVAEPVDEGTGTLFEVPAGAVCIGATDV